MKQGDEVIYTIAISHIADNQTIRLISDRLKNREVLGQYQRIRPAIEETNEPGAIFVPRLFTRWRGEGVEEAWQENVKAACTHPPTTDCTITISVEPWSHAPGYPQGELEEKRS